MGNPTGRRLLPRRSRSAPNLLMYLHRESGSRYHSLGNEADIHSCKTILVNPKIRDDLPRNKPPSTPLEVMQYVPCQSSDNFQPRQKEDDEVSNFVVWNNPKLRVKFRDWYTYNFCSLSNVRTLSRIQSMCRPLEPFITFYFKFWSLSGEAEFYVVFIPTFIWIGFPKGALEVASMLCVTQYVTGTLKDLCCCPRPPCPPLNMRGRRKTHSTEYGFPSTHSSNSIIFSYFFFRQLYHSMPKYQYLWIFIAIFFSLNVSYSRLYLGMHWIGDVVGGWMAAIFCILLHMIRLNYLEYELVNLDNPPWWCFILVYVVLHIFAIFHATPHDPCPCYLDSLRFLGVTLGSLYGFWIFKSIFGTLSARTYPKNILRLLISYRFWMEWGVCIVIVVIAKELSALIGVIVLKRVFKFLAGAYGGAFPPRVRRGYLLFARLVGYVTRGRARGPCLSALSGPAAMGDRNESRSANGHADPTAAGETREGTDRNSGWTPTSPHNPKSAITAVTITTREEQQNGERVKTPTQTKHLTWDENEGYLNEYQVWSLRTHKHWWLWEAHKYTLSYAVMGFMVVCISQLVLIKIFKIK